jgi:hypothetical protein
MVYAQSSPRATVLVVSENPEEGPSPAKFAAALRRLGRARPILRDGSGVFLGSEGRIAAGTMERGREALERGREHLRLLQFPEAESALDEAVRALADVGTPDGFAMRRDAEVSLAVARLESGRRDAALRTFVAALIREPGLALDEMRYSPFVREALDQARSTATLLPHGGLRVESQPAGLDVYLDGTLLGKTPVATEDVVAGEHVVAVVASGGAWSRTVPVPAGEAARVEVLDDAGSGGAPEMALRLARALEADRFVVLSAGPQGRVRGRVGDVSTGRLGVARESDSEESLALALREEAGFPTFGRPEQDDGHEATRPERTPWYEKWWIYAIGVGVVGGAITAAAVVQNVGPDPTDVN